MLADGVCADVAILGMEFDGTDGIRGKVVAIEALDRFTASEGGEAGEHEGAIFSEEGSEFGGVAFLGGKDPTVAEVGEDIGIGRVGTEGREGGREKKEAKGQLTDTVHQEYRLLSSIGVIQWAGVKEAEEL